jgi:hypothetical protein
MHQIFDIVLQPKNKITMLSPTTIPAAIADNLCAQLIAFQQQIATRTDAAQFPSMQEVNLQTKLITNIIKINKHNATDIVTKAITEFLRFLKKDDPQLSKLVTEKYAQFMGLDTPTEETPAPAIPTPAYITGDAPPFDEAYFHQEKERLDSSQLNLPTSTVSFKGRWVPLKWLEYNLIQYLLPVEERRFHANPDNFMQTIDHNTVYEKILEVKARLGIEKIAA